MSCPDCQRTGSKKSLWIALVAVIAVGAIGIAELTRADGRDARGEARHGEAAQSVNVKAAR